MQVPPSAKEINAAAGKKGCDAIPYADLRAAGQREYQKQQALCKDDDDTAGLTLAHELEAALHRAQMCREQRIKVRTIFKEAIGRVRTVLQGMKAGVPLKPGLEKILRELENSQKGHEIAIEQVNRVFVKCEEKLKRIKG